MKMTLTNVEILLHGITIKAGHAIIEMDVPLPIEINGKEIDQPIIDIFGGSNFLKPDPPVQKESGHESIISSKSMVRPKKKKICEHCGAYYMPTSGVQKRCDSCREIKKFIPPADVNPKTGREISDFE